MTTMTPSSHPIPFAEAQAQGLFRAWVTRVIDGDTIEAEVSLGFTVRVRVVFRYEGIDAPEVVGTTRAAGLAASAFLADLIPVGAPILLRTTRVRRSGEMAVTFGRYVAVVYRVGADGGLIDTGAELVAAGHAVRSRP